MKSICMRFRERIYQLLKHQLIKPIYRHVPCRHIDTFRNQCPLEELILFEHFIYTREVLGLRVSGRQVTLMFLSILSVTRPIGWKDAKGSSGWLTRWKCRFDIGAKIATRKKEKSLAEIAQFHRPHHRGPLSF